MLVFKNLISKLQVTFFLISSFVQREGGRQVSELLLRHERLRLDLRSLQVLQRMVNEGLSPAANYTGTEPLFLRLSYPMPSLSN